MQLVFIADIDFVNSPCLRERISSEIIAEYAEAFRAKEVFPPPILFKPKDSKQFLIADGWHRLRAAQSCEMKALPCDVRDGSYREALALACGCNVKHGFRRTNEDKRKTVKTALGTWPEESDHSIAKRCAVSHVFVAKIRAMQNEPAPPPKRIGLDGKLRLATQAKNKAAKQRNLIAEGLSHDLKGCNRMIDTITKTLRDLKAMERCKDPAVREALLEIENAFIALQLELVAIDSQPTISGKARGSLQEIKTFFSELKLPDNDAEYFFHKCEGNGWRVANHPIKDWRSTVRAWVKMQIFPSQKANSENNRTSNRNFGTGINPQDQGKAISDALSRRTAAHH